MVDFNLVLQSGPVTDLVQRDLLAQQFEAMLFPKLLFRSLVKRNTWQANLGENKFFTSDGLLPLDLRPMVPGQDPTPVTYPAEQWEATMRSWSATQDVYMPNDYAAIAGLFMQACKKAGLQAGQHVNRLIRNRMFAAAESGQTVADGTQNSATLRVRRLNGFTRARNATTVGASQVRFAPVSSSNPLTIRVYDNTVPSYVTRTVTAYTPDYEGDEMGPGTLTLNSAVDVTDRAVVQAVDRSYVYRAGGGEKNDDVGSSDIATMQALRDVLAHQRQNNVPEMPDGTCHVHIDPVVEGQLFRDDEFKLLFRGSLGNATPYQDFVVQRILGCTFYRNTENPLPGTVVGRGTGTRGYDVRDPFVGELYNNGNSSTGVVLHRALFVWGDACMEYAADLQQLITEAGVQGKVSNSIVTPNGITIDFDKFQFLIMAPSNRLANKVPITWQLWADWVMRTDACTGDDARYKRTALAVFGE